ncbi:heat shock 70 kDa protein 12B-like isoform X2 [Argopecten irradians]|uniref:heat shock 70 kDa protein 12B-like isoform X2 n=1 Tax=Argopecten irradians TaxID=31199 RepID=UPI00371581E8
MDLRDDFQLVVAIDFGTTYTGYAYSTRHEFKADPIQIHLMNWNAGSAGLVSQKAPTCVLFKPDQSFDSFGFEAEDNYNELALDDKHGAWFFFRRFKMELYKDHAGIAGNQLLIALEPEAASMLCKHMPGSLLLSGDRADKLESFRVGCRYMVLDAGGGTIDITVHEVASGGSLKEIYEANGGDWGGTKVDESFENLLKTIVGEPAFSHFKANDVPSVIDLQRNFEVKKRTFTGKDTGNKTTITVPCSLLESFKECNPDKHIKDAIQERFLPEDVAWNRDKIRLSLTKAHSMFEPSLKHISEHVSEILHIAEVQKCEAILLVGGYSECPLLQDSIRSVVGNRRLIIPNGAGLAVLKGAVINGHRPDTLSQRICKYTYGISLNFPFGEDGYDKYRYVNNDGDVKCGHCFKIFVNKGSHVSIGESSVTREVYVGYALAKSIHFSLYASTSEHPKYVTEKSCQRLGGITLDMPDTTLGKARGANATIYFGGSEIKLTAEDKHTGEKISACFDFLG